MQWLKKSFYIKMYTMYKEIVDLKGKIFCFLKGFNASSYIRDLKEMQKSEKLTPLPNRFGINKKIFSISTNGNF